MSVQTITTAHYKSVPSEFGGEVGEIQPYLSESVFSFLSTTTIGSYTPPPPPATGHAKKTKNPDIDDE